MNDFKTLSPYYEQAVPVCASVCPFVLHQHSLAAGVPHDPSGGYESRPKSAKRSEFGGECRNKVEVTCHEWWALNTLL